MTALLGGTLISMIPYRRPGLVLVPGMAPGHLVLALQRDLRALGYLRNGLDGHFGPATTAAVRALQHDLLFNDGRGRDGRAPGAMRVPMPFLLAVLAQESGLRHFRVPRLGDPDDFLVIGLNRGDAVRPDHITSRGYGIGQYTLFHHPPRADEVRTVMIDPLLNVRRAA